MGGVHCNSSSSRVGVEEEDEDEEADWNGGVMLSGELENSLPEEGGVLLLLLLKYVGLILHTYL